MDNGTMSQTKAQQYRNTKISSTHQDNIHNGWHQIKNYQAHGEAENATHLGQLKLTQNDTDDRISRQEH